MTGPVQRLLDAIHAGLLPRSDGRVATYIPELGHADPSWFGLGLATLDGHVYGAGDDTRSFTIQSVSKPFVYALALADRGVDEVIRRVGVEPTGEAFNAVTLEAGTGRPLNPMVNAGAIVTATLVDGPGPHERFARVRAGLSAFAGRELDVDTAVVASETETGDLNRALAYLMRNAGSLDVEVDEALLTYFSQCSLLVTAHDLAVMAATLGNRGVNPRTGRPVVSAQTAGHVLTVMATCGMYDFAGEWLFTVGLPAKGGVSGGIVAVLPGELGIGVFSPPVDERGSSVRGVAACQELSRRFELHVMRTHNRSVPVIYRSTSGASVRSSRPRPMSQRDILDRLGQAIQVRELQGTLGFAAAESTVRHVLADHDRVEWLVLDLHRVDEVETVAMSLLDALVQDLDARGVGVVVVDPWRRALPGAVRRHESLDEALQSCEDALIARSVSES